MFEYDEFWSDNFSVEELACYEDYLEEGFDTYLGCYTEDC